MYNEIMRERVRVYKKHREMCWTFARQVIETNIAEYARRGQTKQEKILAQIARGKIAEFAVFQHLQFVDDLPKAYPDLNVYSKSDKSYDADLQIGGMDVHVKTQTFKNKTRYGASWVFQKNDPLLTEPKQNDLIALTHQAATDTEYVEIVGYFHAVDLEGAYGEPVLPYLRRTKAVLYFDDIKELFPNNG